MALKQINESGTLVTEWVPVFGGAGNIPAPDSWFSISTVNHVHYPGSSVLAPYYVDIKAGYGVGSFTGSGSKYNSFWLRLADLDDFK